MSDQGIKTPPRLLAEVRDAINKARAERGEQPIDDYGRTPDGKQAYRLDG